MLIKHLDNINMRLAMDNQILQGNKSNPNLDLRTPKEKGGFRWRESPQGFDFWECLENGEDPAKVKKAEPTKKTTKKIRATESRGGKRDNAGRKRSNYISELPQSKLIISVSPDQNVLPMAHKRVVQLVMEVKHSGKEISAFNLAKSIQYDFKDILKLDK
jgi:hypothetical protein